MKKWIILFSIISSVAQANSLKTVVCNFPDDPSKAQTPLVIVESALNLFSVYQTVSDNSSAGGTLSFGGRSMKANKILSLVQNEADIEGKITLGQDFGNEWDPTSTSGERVVV